MNVQKILTHLKTQEAKSAKKLPPPQVKLDTEGLGFNAIKPNSENLKPQKVKLDTEGLDFKV